MCPTKSMYSTQSAGDHLFGSKSRSTPSRPFVATKLSMVCSAAVRRAGFFSTVFAPEVPAETVT